MSAAGNHVVYARANACPVGRPLARDTPCATRHASRSCTHAVPCGASARGSGARARPKGHSRGDSKQPTTALRVCR
eukprot:2207283-Prymnesium_polylepis.1